MASFIDFTFSSLGWALTLTISLSLSSSCEFWEVDADRLEKNSTQLVPSSLHVGRVGVASEANLPKAVITFVQTNLNI